MKFLRFCAVGGVNTVVGLTMIYVSMRIFNLNYIVANMIGYGIGFIISFLLNRSWTFDYSGPILANSVVWAAVVVCSYIINIFVVVIMHDIVRVDVYVAQSLGIVTYTILSFLGGRYYVFRAVIPGDVI